MLMFSVPVGVGFGVGIVSRAVADESRPSGMASAALHSFGSTFVRD